MWNRRVDADSFVYDLGLICPRGITNDRRGLSVAHFTCGEDASNHIRDNMAEEKSIVVLGSLNMDLVMVTPRIPAAGETMHGTSFSSYPGGKGLNQAVAVQRLLPKEGWKTHMIGRVGDDEFSEKLRDSLSTEGIDISEVKTAAGKASGVALILVTPESIPRANHR